MDRAVAFQCMVVQSVTNSRHRASWAPKYSVAMLGVANAADGSSPRVRGTRDGGGHRLLDERFIPACAGNATRSSSSRTWGLGSSPRVRGTHRRAGRPAARRRFIPACAGNACRSTPPNTLASVHPRVCGERSTTSSARSGCCGSSPRVRGTRAGAGQGPQKKAVHPRVCGERDIGRISDELGIGSSPRVRGTRERRRRGGVVVRFIPACAGNALMNGFWSSSTSGSSPRVRGTRPDGGGSSQCGRFIPACAGNAQRAWTLREEITVHPRVCGERIEEAIQGTFRNGSSPRVRGTRGRRGPAQRGRRFIPACAGNASATVGSERNRTGSSPRGRGTHTLYAQLLAA